MPSTNNDPSAEGWVFDSADTILPNIRRTFIPNPGHLILDCDLSGADAQVVAWEADDADLKSAFRAGLDIHDHNGRAVWGENYQRDAKPRKYTMRDELKRGVHGTNYLSSARGMAQILGWKIRDVEHFQSIWFRLHPKIGGRDPNSWHARTELAIRRTRTITNSFGFRIVYFDRPENLLPKALAWGPQSTVAITCTRAALQLRRYCPWAGLLLQVHDSLVFQIPIHRDTPSAYREIRQALRVEVPYPDPLVIPWGLARSDKSWGHVAKTKWDDVL